MSPASAISPAIAHASAPLCPNATKHGLTATRYVSPEQAQRREAIKAELESTHRPETDEESELIDRLALERARLYDAEANHRARVQAEKLVAQELYERRARDRFVLDLKAWRKDPTIMGRVFTETYHGTAFLADLWGSVAAGLKEGLGVTDEQMRDMVASVASHWQVSQINAAGARLMGFFLSMQDDPENAVERWVDDSRDGEDRPGLRKEDQHRARRMLATAPPAAEASSALMDEAMRQTERWTKHAKDLRTKYEMGRSLAPETAMGLGASDPDSAKAARLAFRYLISATNRVEKLERRLEAIKKMRPLNALRSGRPVTPVHSPSSRSAPNSRSEPDAQPKRSGSVDSSQPNDGSTDTIAVRNVATGESRLVGNSVTLPKTRNSRRPDAAQIARSFREKERNRFGSRPEMLAP